MHQTPPHVIERIMELTRAGETIRAIRRLTGASKGTIAKYQKANDVSEILCPCGKPVRHRAWCSERFRKSEKRQEFMRRWHPKELAREVDDVTI